ncbi:MAG: hypothetical protein WAL61_07880 [Acidimicrobiales bacterium]
MSDSATTTQAGSSDPAPGPSGSGGPSGPPTGAAEEPGTSLTKKIVVGGIIVLLVVALALLIATFDSTRHWFALHTGILHGGPDQYYNFWSGFGSDLGEATLITAVAVGVYTGVRKVNCHTKGCWRIGHHVLEGTPYILCRHHHPGVPSHGASHAHILAQHQKFKADKEAREARGLS